MPGDWGWSETMTEGQGETLLGIMADIRNRELTRFEQWEIDRSLDAERQRFIDSAAMQFYAQRSCPSAKYAYDSAEALWDEREKRRTA